MRRFYFIINPISGKGKQDSIIDLIKASSKKFQFEFEAAYTEEPNQATQLTEKAIRKGFDAVISVGGDGTLNEIMKVLIDSGTKLGIIPTGSGNGMARHLNIPLEIEKAIEIIAKYKYKKIDTSVVNGHPFIMMAGVGFDAEIAWQFSQSDKRGLSTYAKLAIGSYRNFQPTKYKIIIDGVIYEREALLISFANGSQYGNNFTISPEAKEDDGLIDVCILSKFPVLKAPVVSLRMLTNSIHESPYLEIIQGKEIQIRQEIDKLNLDGEAIELNAPLKVKVNPLSLDIIIP